MGPCMETRRNQIKIMQFVGVKGIIMEQEWLNEIEDGRVEDRIVCWEGKLNTKEHLKMLYGNLYCRTS